ncbi:UNVERIFIED_CONTAM: hypothetical protein GTU68_029198 [Idotea baltica]|nr:hypothetical protein [Idotea baltica]
MSQGPDPGTRFPLKGYDRLCFLNQVVDHPQIEIGDYTYYDDFEDVHNFEKNVKYLFDFVDDALVIGRFCMIASGVSFIMNGANHLTDAVSTYPFAIFGHGWENAMEGKTYPNRGKTTIGHDVWIGHKATIMAGVTVGSGAIIAAHSLVTKDVPPYAVVGGNPAQVIKMRFPQEDIERLLALEWWHWPTEKITANLSWLTGKQPEGLDSGKP